LYISGAINNAIIAIAGVTHITLTLGIICVTAILVLNLIDDNDDDVYLVRKIKTKVSENLILHKNADQPKA
jgi:hypothetical protein